MDYSTFAGVAKAASLPANINRAAIPTRQPADFTRAYDAWLDLHVLGCYDISRDPSNSFFDDAGDPIQLGWLLICRSNPWDRCAVTYDGDSWACVDPQCNRYGANAYIAAVKRHLALKRAARLQLAAQAA